MPMIPFVERFPDLGPRETRTLTITGGDDPPPGEYGFFEFYCNEENCDCRRVVIRVLRSDTGWEKVWATISYGWESPEFYRKKLGPFADPEELTGPFLDSLNPQSQYAPALLNLFRATLQSAGYAERLQRHYRMFRTAVEADHARRNRRR